MVLPSFQFDSTASIPAITQQLLRHFGGLELRGLFHNEIPIARYGPWSWCPPSIFDLGQTRDALTNDPSMRCSISADGLLRCKLQAIQFRDDDLIIPCGSHSAILSRISVALANRAHCVLLADPWPKVGRGFGQMQFILAKPVRLDPTGPDGSSVLKCSWVGMVSLALASINPRMQEEPASIAVDERQLWHMTCEFGRDVDVKGGPLSSIPMMEAGESARATMRSFKGTLAVMDMYGNSIVY
ncbi:hypothetical protein GGR57DRAFT_459987 [Xylariaceae sp. FL1272]|nr:hypothetical protein GGR57DRAFT_459987 [Xylariaceae sp. FL1272]